MKKSKYITKYDYINYYVKQPNMWFFTNEEIDSAYKLQKEVALDSLNYKFLNPDNYDEEEDQENYETKEEHNYDIYKENKVIDNLIDSSDNDNKLISGRLIDGLSKQYILDYYSNEYRIQFESFDFDEINDTLENNFFKTKQLLEKENIILFQPTFIDYEKNILTKCDAIVKYQNEIFLIETKATSSSKIHHFLDIFFQKKIIEKTISTQKNHIVYNLCLIKYERLNKSNQISFIVTDTINLKKTATRPNWCTTDNIEIVQSIKIGREYTYLSSKPKKHESVFINDILDLDFIALGNLEDSKNKVKVELITNVVNNFDFVINELWNHKKQMDSNPNQLPKKFVPHKNDKSEFKNTDLWLDLRLLYALEGYELFQYSGSVCNQSGENIIKYCEFVKNGALIDWNLFIKEYFIRLFFLNSKNIVVNKPKYQQLKNKIKSKKVYFDFETINPAFRVIDNSFAFTQVVTQNSVIIDSNSSNELVCNNLMIDPSNYNNDFLKDVIDSIYQGDDYSYIVYNKSFECTRLEEMKIYLNQDPIYNKKIDIIKNNIFDLADFFKFEGAIKSGNNDRYCIFLKELYGFSSIKKVLALIEKKDKKIFDECKCLDYKKLNIQNGSMCQQKSLLRFFNIFGKEYINDDEWQNVVRDSKIYCENDVRAMIAVLKFIEKISEYNF